jgi:hypothetical protein
MPLTSTSGPDSIALERERNLRELTGCEAKQRSARSSILHIDGGPFGIAWSMNGSCEDFPRFSILQPQSCDS